MPFSFRDIRAYVRAHEGHASVAALLLGFVWDSLTFGRADEVFGNIVFVSYFLLSAMAILLLSFYRRRERAAPLYLAPLTNFAFGSIASGLLIVYGHSGSIEGSWVFFILLLAFIVGNEFARGSAAQFNFHISAWYFLLFAYLAMIVPVLLGRLGPSVFALSALASLTVTSVFLLILSLALPKGAVINVGETARSIFIVCAFFSGLYAANVIPPVPLSLTGIGVYHSVERLPSGDYRATYEEPHWYELFRSTGKTFSRGEGESAACFSAVFAPVRLATGVVHRWEYFDAAREEWQVRAEIVFPLTGGRAGGYRGYTVKSDLARGYWRCSVTTENGALVGRTTFKIVDGVPELREREL